MTNLVILLSTAVVCGKRSTQRQISTLYAAALERAGHHAVLYTGGDPAQLCQRCDGLLLTGGGDIHPDLYGASPSTEHLSIDCARDEEELSLTRAFCSQNKPILGICRGLQVLNVFFGGTLFQDISNHDEQLHMVSTVSGTRTAQLIGSSLITNSYHHQAVNQLGKNLHSSAFATDGQIEAAEHIHLPILGVQWHPERMIHGLCADTDYDQTILFHHFFHAS